MDIDQGIAKYIGTEILPGTDEQSILSSESLFDDGIVDSLGLQQLINYLEGEYGIFVEEEHLIPENFETIAGIGALVGGLVDAAA